MLIWTCSIRADPDWRLHSLSVLPTRLEVRLFNGIRP